HAVDTHARELRTETTHGELPALSLLARDGDARNALQRLCQVLIRKLTDILREDGVGLGGHVLLELQGLFQAAAVAGHHDLLERRRRVVLRSGGGQPRRSVSARGVVLRLRVDDAGVDRTQRQDSAHRAVCEAAGAPESMARVHYPPPSRPAGGCYR